MAPPGPVPDHYGALEVSPNCSIEDINKAYKKLGSYSHASEGATFADVRSAKVPPGS